jgi:8-oxo-dGTP pyrophosphatase MutT (NUDIX family)
MTAGVGLGDPWYTALPGVTSAVGALVLDDRGRVLLARPAYKPEWVLVGGTVDRDEAPVSALRRELREELGALAADRLSVGQLRVTDWVAPRAGWDRPMHHLVFDCAAADPGTVLDDAVVAEELRAVEFLPVARAVRLLAPYEGWRLEMALLARRTNRHFYLETGRLPGTDEKGAPR